MSKIIWKAMGVTILLGASGVIGYNAATLVAGMF
jgi:hypothetical protein